MIDYFQHLEHARRFIQTAEHLLTETFPLVRDPRMLLSVLQNVYGSYKSMMLFYLNRDLEQGKIPPFDQDPENMIRLFKARNERRYSINPDYVKNLEEIYAILKEHRKSPMEFSRHEMLVISDESYNMKTVTTQRLRDYINKAKTFIVESSPARVEHGRIS